MHSYSPNPTKLINLYTHQMVLHILSDKYSSMPLRCNNEHNRLKQLRVCWGKEIKCNDNSPMTGANTELL